MNKELNDSLIKKISKSLDNLKLDKLQIENEIQKCYKHERENLEKDLKKVNEEITEKEKEIEVVKIANEVQEKIDKENKEIDKEYEKLLKEKSICEIELDNEVGKFTIKDGKLVKTYEQEDIERDLKKINDYISKIDLLREQLSDELKKQEFLVDKLYEKYKINEKTIQQEDEIKKQEEEMWTDYKEEQKREKDEEMNRMWDEYDKDKNIEESLRKEREKEEIEEYYNQIEQEEIKNQEEEMWKDYREEQEREKKEQIDNLWKEYNRIKHPFGEELLRECSEKREIEEYYNQGEQEEIKNQEEKRRNYREEVKKENEQYYKTTEQKEIEKNTEKMKYNIKENDKNEKNFLYDITCSIKEGKIVYIINTLSDHKFEPELVKYEKIFEPRKLTHKDRDEIKRDIDIKQFKKIDIGVVNILKEIDEEKNTDLYNQYIKEIQKNRGEKNIDFKYDLYDLKDANINKEQKRIIKRIAKNAEKFNKAEYIKPKNKIKEFFQRFKQKLITSGTREQGDEGPSREEIIYNTYKDLSKEKEFEFDRFCKDMKLSDEEKSNLLIYEKVNSTKQKFSNSIKCSVDTSQLNPTVYSKQSNTVSKGKDSEQKDIEI